MQFRHISAKIQPKNRKQHFNWGPGAPLGQGVGPCLAFVCVLATVQFSISSSRQKYLILWKFKFFMATKAQKWQL